MGFLTPAKLEPKELGTRRRPSMADRLLRRKMREETLSLDRVTSRLAAIKKELSDLRDTKEQIKRDAMEDLETLAAVPRRTAAQEKEVEGLQTLIVTLEADIRKLNGPSTADSALSRLPKEIMGH